MWYSFNFQRTNGSTTKTILLLTYTFSLFLLLHGQTPATTTKITTTRAYIGVNTSVPCPQKVYGFTQNDPATKLVVGKNREWYNWDCTSYIAHTQHLTLAQFCLYYGEFGYGKDVYPNVPRCCDSWEKNGCFRMPQTCPKAIGNETAPRWESWRTVGYWYGCLYFPNTYPSVDVFCNSKKIFGWDLMNCCTHWKSIKCY